MSVPSKARLQARLSWAVFPALGWLLWFLIAPIAIVLVYSFLSKGPHGEMLTRFQWSNYGRASEWIYLRVFLSSVWLATWTSFSCLAIGYPMAYVMAKASRRVQQVLLMMIVVPFWTNLLLRAYAIKFLLGVQGPVSQLLLALGLVETPRSWAYSGLSVWLGMITNYLPFMVIPLYVFLEKFDFRLLEAARDLGASSLQLLTRVLLPLSKRAILTGVLLVFVPALGEFVVPEILGGGRRLLMGNLITEQFLKARDWPFGSALSVLLIAPVLLVLLAQPSGAPDSDKEVR